MKITNLAMLALVISVSPCAAQVAGVVDFTGVYHGLVRPEGFLEASKAGSFRIKVTKSGSFTGKMITGWFVGREVSFRGRFDSTGHAWTPVYFNFADKNSPYYDYLREHWGYIYLELLHGGEEILGHATQTYLGYEWSSRLVGLRADYDRATKTAGAPQAGNYTFAINDREQPDGIFAGAGHGTVKISSKGKVKYGGVLPDGTMLIGSCAISAGGWWPLHQSHFTGLGVALGWVGCVDRGDRDLEGLLQWIRPARSGNPEIRTTLAFLGSRYRPPAKGGSLFTWSEGRVAFCGGHLTDDFAHRILLGRNNQLINLDVNPLKLILNPRNGAFKGSVTEPQSGRAFGFNGVVLQKLDCGFGRFGSESQSGRVDVGP